VSAYKESPLNCFVNKKALGRICDREQRCENPMSVFDFFTCEPSFPHLEMGMLVASLATMNDVLPGGDDPKTRLVDETKRWYNRPRHNYSGHGAHMLKLLIDQKVGCSAGGKLTIHGDVPHHTTGK